MMQVYYIDSTDTYHLIGEYDTAKQCRAAIAHDYESKGFKSYYWNVYELPSGDTMHIDYGSHTTFYEITNCCMYDYNK